MLARLVEIPNVQMIKDSTGDLVQFQRVLEERSEDLISSTARTRVHLRDFFTGPRAVSGEWPMPHRNTA